MELDLSVLNDVQREAVECTEGPCIVSAGAGSGKTRVLTYRVANLLINKNVSPRNILAITFTNKAANEMRERLNSMLSNANECTICTFHALGVRILRECHNFISPRTKYFSIYDETDKKSFIKKIIKELGEDEKMVDTYINFICNAKNAGISPEKYEEFFGFHSVSKTTSKIYKEYEKQMEQNNAYDFDDLLCKPYDLLIHSDTVRNYYTDKYKYILVDEFQDTNEIQYKLLKILQSKWHNIFVVGDEDQSIYSWRGADSRNMMKYIDDFSCTQIFKLEQNYRSTDKILEVANTIIKKNADRLDKQLWTNKKGGVRVEYKSYGTEQYEADGVVRDILSLVNYGSEYKDMAVLVRMNALTRVLEDKFLSYNIPYKIYGGVKFYDRTEVKNVLAYLKCVNNQKDDECFLRIINFPKRKIGEVAIKNLKNLGQNQSLMETLMSIDVTSPLPKTQLESFLSVKHLFEKLIQDAENVSISKLVNNLLEEIDIEKIYDKDKEEDLSRLMNIKELISAIKEFENQNREAKLNDYLQAVTLITDIDSYESQDEAVTIATVHAVKGLEFKCVHIVGLEEGIFPLMRYDNADDELEEERRLMYVAVTRAKERLYISHSQSRFLYGKRSQNIPSRYLEDLGYIKHKDTPFIIEDYDGYGYNSGYKTGFNSHSNYNNNSDNSYSQNNNNNSIPTRESYFSNNLASPVKNSLKFTGTEIKKTINSNGGKVYKQGQKVRHQKFGDGIVVSFEPDRNCVAIAFSGIGIKKLDTTIAKLEVID